MKPHEVAYQAHLREQGEDRARQAARAAEDEKERAELLARVDAALATLEPPCSAVWADLRMIEVRLPLGAPDEHARAAILKAHTVVPVRYYVTASRAGRVGVAALWATLCALGSRDDEERAARVAAVLDGGAL